MSHANSVLQTHHFAKFKGNYDNEVTSFIIAAHLNAFLFIGFRYYWFIFKVPS